MGESAGAINVYALMASALMVNANPKLFHRAMPMSGGISLASNLPPGSFPTLNTAAVVQAQGNALLHNVVIADGWQPTPPARPGSRRRPGADQRLPRSKDPASS